MLAASGVRLVPGAAGGENVRAKSFFFPRLMITTVATAARPSFLPARAREPTERMEAKELRAGVHDVAVARVVGAMEALGAHDTSCVRGAIKTPVLRCVT